MNVEALFFNEDVLMPIGPSHPAVAWHLQRWTLVCSRSWGSARAVALCEMPSCVSQPPFPAATVQPFYPNPQLREWLFWKSKG